MSKDAKKKIAKELNRDAIANVSSDVMTDIIYSLTTDLLRGLFLDGNINDLDRAIETVNVVTKDISSNGINLRKANIDRRKQNKKDVDPLANKETIEWVRLDKRLEYTKDLRINGKYPLKKRKEDIIIALLTEEQLDGKDDINYKLSSKEKEKIFSMGFKYCSDK